MLTYKNYVAKVTIDDEDGALQGRIVGIRSIISFEGRTVEELKQAFHETVDDYLELCKERGVEPSKPYSGRFQVRVGVDTHRLLSQVAEAKGVSLNAVVRNMLNYKLAKIRLSDDRRLKDKRRPIDDRRSSLPVAHGSAADPHPQLNPHLPGAESIFPHDPRAGRGIELDPDR